MRTLRQLPKGTADRDRVVVALQRPIAARANRALIFFLLYSIRQVPSAQPWKEGMKFGLASITCIMPARQSAPKVYRCDVGAEAATTVSERYLSICVDLGQIATPTRFWNPDGSGEVICRPPFDFARPQLINMTAELAPAYLRIGGTEADRVFYALEGEAPKEPPGAYRSTLAAASVDAIGEFSKAAGLEVCFTVNAGEGSRDERTGVWSSAQARALMRYAKTRALPFTVWELGNEPNAYPLFHDNLLVTPEEYARDLHELGKARDAEAPPGSLIAGPATAWWPSMGEVPVVTQNVPPTVVRNFLKV